MSEERLGEALEAAGYAGTWERRGDRIVLDAAAAALLLDDAELGGLDLDAQVLTLRMEPKDRLSLAAALVGAGLNGGRHQVEYTVRTDAGERRLAERGRFEADRDGCMRGIGVIVDLTPDAAPEAGDTPLEHAARTCMALHHLIAELPEGTAMMRKLADMLLLEFGFRVAQQATQRSGG
ncbi:hypothetical protein BHAOGJBA_2898 [Methylobacterium hispanicum]|uniref:Uncharacterized protein n=1 Tax=Methylobacterium hispanicum TaxID=270350 RepID=A0AAV4ZMJ8_9HYPH|nr:hypothetical protein [Methylobacterium hispanicum]GJD89371.1 hypothetical protein BHAOGJBA_2898 [Methylobacterium hispanicum]